jgi:hypothetical protein
MAFDRRRQETKQPYEEWPTEISFGYSGGAFYLPPGANQIVSSEAFAVKWHRRDSDNKTDASLEILQSTTPIIINPGRTKLVILIKGGMHDYDYQITIRVVFDNGTKLEEELLIRVRED